MSNWDSNLNGSTNKRLVLPPSQLMDELSEFQMVHSRHRLPRNKDISSDRINGQIINIALHAEMHWNWAAVESYVSFPPPDCRLQFYNDVTRVNMFWRRPARPINQSRLAFSCHLSHASGLLLSLVVFVVVVDVNRLGKVWLLLNGLCPMIPLCCCCLSKVVQTLPPLSQPSQHQQYYDGSSLHNTTIHCRSIFLPKVRAQNQKQKQNQGIGLQRKGSQIQEEEEKRSHLYHWSLKWPRGKLSVFLEAQSPRPSLGVEFSEKKVSFV